MTDFDLVVVGGGMAGCAAAIVAAQNGLEVLLVERGESVGVKNMTGGRLYSHSLESILPGFAQEAPVERCVAREKVSFMTEDSMVTIDFHSERLARQGADSYVVLRSTFDAWLGEQAEEAGVVIAPGVRVDELLMRDGRVAGIKADEDEIESHMVILADGVNSLLAHKAGLKPKLTGHQVAVGAKEVIELPAQTIEDRFNLNPGEGASWLMSGCTEGGVGGGFLYTNAESISLGLVLTASEVRKIKTSVPELMENLKNHPSIRPLIKGGTSVEYSAHMVPEGGQDMVPTLYADNVMVVGDAAGLVINTGYMVRGMDLAVASGHLAALTAVEAKQKEDYSAATLESYKTRLDASFVGQDMRTYRKFPHFLETTPRIFSEYPALLADVMTDLFQIDGTPAVPLRKRLFGYLKRIGLRTLVRDGLRGVRAL